MRTRTVTPAQARAYASKAKEYADAAAAELGEGRVIAATSLAIHAAINAADAVYGARLGRRAASQDHDRALSLLREAGKGLVAEVDSDQARLCAPGRNRTCDAQFRK
jgi:hypothetical protein